MSNSVGDASILLSEQISLRWMITLLHFVWQGAVTGVLVAIAARLLRRGSASMRYALYSVSLVSLPICVAVTFSLVQIPVSLQLSDPSDNSANVIATVIDELPKSAIPIFDLSSSRFAPPSTIEPAPQISGVRLSPDSVWERWLVALSQVAPWTAACYLIGACCFLLRLGIALWGGHRLRATATRLTESPILELIAAEARKVGLRLVPVVACCQRVAVPTVVGIMRPVILLPASILTGLTSEEFAAIISHELAHIRRYDLWMNLLQRITESLLFFHPVVWFLSHRLSAEREICCDDLVVSSGNERMNYAGALLRMAELCATSRQQNIAALAANNGEPSLLEHRIHRLMNEGKTPRMQLTRAGVLTLMLTLLSLIATPAVVSNWTHADEPDKLNLSAAVSDETAATSSVTVEERYPYCVINVDGLKTRPLADAIKSFNREALESPIGRIQSQVSEQETRDAIAKFVEQEYVPDSVKAVLREIAISGALPPTVYFRRFTRFDDEQQMHGVWWVRLVVETSEPPVYSVPVRTTSIFSRPYTQMERQQNAADGLTLINRVASYYENTPVAIEPTELPKAAVDALVKQTQAALNAEDVEALKALSDWTNAPDSMKGFSVSELQKLTQSTIHSIKVTPGKLQGNLLTWSAWQFYKPNLPVAGFLEIAYTPEGSAPEVRKSVSLELGHIGTQLRLLNYIPDGKPLFPKSIDQTSIRGQIEPLADGTCLVSDIITNPRSMLSAHLANEEVRQRDFKQNSPNANAVQKVGDDASPVRTAVQKVPDSPAVSKDEVGSKVTVRRRIVNSVDGSPIAGARVSVEHMEREYPGGEEDGYGIWWDIKQVKQVSKTELISDADGYIDYETPTTIPKNIESLVTFKVSHEKYVPTRSMIPLSFLRDRNPLPESLRNIKLWPGQEVTGIVLTPDGSPAANTPIYGSTLFESEGGAQSNRSQYLYDISTDNQGHFRFPVASPGRGLCWIVSEQYPPLSIVVSSKNPNLGVLRLEAGNKIKGIVRDANGTPLAGIKIAAGPLSPAASDVMEFLKQTRGRIQGAYRREAESDSDGRFVLPPVHAGKYEINVSDRVSRVENDVTVVNPASYAGVFIRQVLEVTSDPQEIILNAVPSLDIQFKTVDSEGHPESGIEFTVSGRTSDPTSQGFAAIAKYRTKGIAVVRVPAELNKPHVNIRSYSAESGCAFIVRPALKSVYPQTAIQPVPLYRMEFATIGDIPEIQVTRFKATTIDVKVVDEQNQPVADAAPKIEIESPDESLGSSSMRFIKQPDGRWGCTHLIPNVALTVSVEAAGLQSDKQVVTLKEGEQRELTFQMKKAQSLPKDQQQE